MKKKILSAVCALVLVFGSAAVLPEGFAKIDSAITASAAKTWNDYEYEVLDDGTVEISKYTGSDEEVTIPSTIDGKKVTSIGEDAFYWCTSLTSVTIPNSVTSIGAWAFESCESLESVTIPNSVTSIGRSAFCYCTSLTSVTIPNSVTSIGAWAFWECTGLTSVTIPNSVTSIGYWAFGYDSHMNIINGFTIYGYKGSAAETYAKENEFKFIPLDEETKLKKGDLNSNGKIDASDLLQVKSHIKKVKTLTGDEFAAADVDGNGAINAADLLKMKAHMKGVSSIWG